MRYEVVPMRDYSGSLVGVFYIRDNKLREPVYVTGSRSKWTTESALFALQVAGRYNREKV